MPGLGTAHGSPARHATTAASAGDASSHPPQQPPLSPGARYEAERAARIAANEARMAQVLDAKPAGLGCAGPPPPKKAAPTNKRKAPARPAQADPDAPPPRRSGRDRQPKAAGTRATHGEDGDEENEGGGGGGADAGAPYSPGLTREQRLARLEGGRAPARPWQPWTDTAVPALAHKGASTSKALLADADEVRALSVYRADKMTARGVANRVDKLTNLTKLEDFIPVLRAKAAALLAAGEEEEAVEYDRVADVAADKLARLTAERE